MTEKYYCTANIQELYVLSVLYCTVCVCYDISVSSVNLICFPKTAHPDYATVGIASSSFEQILDISLSAAPHVALVWNIPKEFG